EPSTALAIAVDGFHLLATGVWAGGLLPLALLLRAAGREEGADARPYAVLAAHRFSGCALAAVLALVLSGTTMAVTNVGTVAGLVGTRYGRLLLLKIALLVPVLTLAAVNRSVHLPSLSGDGATVGRRPCAATARPRRLPDDLLAPGRPVPGDGDRDGCGALPDELRRLPRDDRRRRRPGRWPPAPAAGRPPRAPHGPAHRGSPLLVDHPRHSAGRDAGVRRPRERGGAVGPRELPPRTFLRARRAQP